MKGLLFIFLILTVSLSYSQNYIIKGKLIEGQCLFPFPYVYVGFDSTTYSITDSAGNFKIIYNKSKFNDTLKIYMLSYYNLRIINLPRDSVINLGVIPIFEYFYPVPLVDFNSRKYNLIDQHRIKKFWRQYDEKRNEFFKEVNTVIRYYKLIYNTKQYSVDVENHILDMKKGN